jgi:hypothetical protein
MGLPVGSRRKRRVGAVRTARLGYHGGRRPVFLSPFGPTRGSKGAGATLGPLCLSVAAPLIESPHGEHLARESDNDAVRGGPGRVRDHDRLAADAVTLRQGHAGACEVGCGKPRGPASAPVTLTLLPCRRGCKAFCALHPFWAAPESGAPAQAPLGSLEPLPARRDIGSREKRRAGAFMVLLSALLVSPRFCRFRPLFAAGRATMASHGRVQARQNLVV